MVRFPLIASLCFVVVACNAKGSTPYARCIELRNLSVANAEQDARDAKMKGDVRLLMIGGLVGEVPGSDGREIAVRMIDGTTDREAPECWKLRRKAENYALRYNEQMLRLLSP